MKCDPLEDHGPLQTGGFPLPCCFQDVSGRVFIMYFPTDIKTEKGTPKE